MSNLEDLIQEEEKKEIQLNDATKKQEEVNELVRELTREETKSSFNKQKSVQILQTESQNVHEVHARLFKISSKCLASFISLSYHFDNLMCNKLQYQLRGLKAFVLSDCYSACNDFAT